MKTPFETRQKLEEFINLRTMDKIDIASILECVPQYYALQSPAFGKVLFEGIDDSNSAFPIAVWSLNVEGKIDKCLHFTKYGHLTQRQDAKCMLFPYTFDSWGSFHWEGYKAGDIVINADGMIQLVSEGDSHTICCSYVQKDDCLLTVEHDHERFFRYASPDEKHLLLAALKRKGYQLGYQLKGGNEVGILKVKHKIFKPFQKVLTVNAFGDNDRWCPTFYSYWDEDVHEHMTVDRITYKDSEILPYEGNENLAGKEVK